MKTTLRLTCSHKIIVEELHLKKHVIHVDSNSDVETNHPLDDVAHVVEQFEHEDEGNVNIPRITTDDHWLNKVVRNVLGMRFESPQQLKHVLANYSVQHDYQLWYMKNDHNKILVFCGRDVSEGKCVGLKGKKPKIVDNEECESSKQGSKKGDGRKAVNEIISKVVKERWDKKKEYEKKWSLNKLIVPLVLIEVVADWLPNVEHRQCTRHIYANFKKRWSRLQFKRLCWAVATTSMDFFFAKMEEIKMLDEKTREWLVERNLNSWCKAYFDMDRCSASFENRSSESFNSRIVGDKGKPIITISEDIRVYLMQRM
ncbi:RNA-directed DNA polymerase, eukaryota [Tanacetum coccineum]